MHYAISYGWSPGDNDTSNDAFAESQIEMIKPFVISTQVSDLVNCLLTQHGVVAPIHTHTHPGMGTRGFSLSLIGLCKASAPVLLFHKRLLTCVQHNVMSERKSTKKHPVLCKAEQKQIRLKVSVLCSLTSIWLLW